MEKRRCQINAIYPITCFTVPIIGHTELKLTTDEIYKCLCAKAEVTEILEDGKMVSLDFSNYDKPIIITDNSKTVENPKEVITEPVEAKNETEVVEPVVEPTVEEKELEVILEAKDEVKVEDETVVETKNETVEEVSKENSTTKSYEVPSRNNNNRKQQNNYKNKNRNHTKNKR